MNNYCFVFGVPLVVVPILFGVVMALVRDDSEYLLAGPLQSFLINAVSGLIVFVLLLFISWVIHDEIAVAGMSDKAVEAAVDEAMRTVLWGGLVLYCLLSLAGHVWYILRTRYSFSAWR